MLPRIHGSINPPIYQSIDPSIAHTLVTRPLSLSLSQHTDAHTHTHTLAAPRHLDVLVAADGAVVAKGLADVVLPPPHGAVSARAAARQRVLALGARHAAALPPDRGVLALGAEVTAAFQAGPIHRDVTVTDTKSPSRTKRTYGAAILGVVRAIRTW